VSDVPAGDTTALATERVDPAAIVAQIEGEVARRRAAGEYPEELLARLRAEFHVEPDDEPPEALAVVEAARPLRSDRPVVGAAVVFAKRATRRLLAWYVHPIAADQTRFNLAVLREVRRLERRLARVETPWSRTPEGGDLAGARAAAYAEALPRAGEGRTLVLGGGTALLDALRATSVDAVAPDAPADRSAAANADPLDALERIHVPTWPGVVVAGLLPRLSAAETLRLFPDAAQALTPGGTLVIDAPVAGEGALAQPAAVDPAMTRWVPPETVLLLCEAAGLAAAARDLGVVDGVRWYAVVATRPRG
jgi:hypothetical protein